jgi:uncharacterized protein (DUF2336 family)
MNIVSLAVLNSLEMIKQRVASTELRKVRQEISVPNPIYQQSAKEREKAKQEMLQKFMEQHHHVLGLSKDRKSKKIRSLKLLFKM